MWRKLVIRDISRGVYKRLMTSSNAHEARKMEGKVAVITGAASGIGRATAKIFVENGAKVVIADINDSMGRDAVKELGGSDNALYIKCDVAREEDVAGTVERAVQRYGSVDVMFNNAGRQGPTGKIVDIDMDEFDKLIEVNMKGMVMGCKHAARAMIKNNKGGCILCTASIAGLMGGVAPVSYAISKFAVHGIVKCVAAEVCGHGIRVNCITPFAMPTPFAVDAIRQHIAGIAEDQVAAMFHNASDLKGGPPCTPQDIAKAALYLASDDGRYVSGHNLVVDGGFSVIKPLALGFPPP